MESVFISNRRVLFLFMFCQQTRVHRHRPQALLCSIHRSSSSSSSRWRGERQKFIAPAVIRCWLQKVPLFLQFSATGTLHFYIIGEWFHIWIIAGCDELNLKCFAPLWSRLKSRAAVTLSSPRLFGPQTLPLRHHSPHCPPRPRTRSRFGGATAAECPAGPGLLPWWTTKATDTHSSWSGKSWSSQQLRVWTRRFRSWWRASGMFWSPIRNIWKRLYVVQVI